jgi:hypothetical protein
MMREDIRKGRNGLKAVIYYVLMLENEKMRYVETTSRMTEFKGGIKKNA